MKRALFLSSLLALSIVGCGKGSSSVVGKWKVDPDFQKANANMKPEGFMTGFAGTFWYDLKADNTFQGSMSEGTYKVDGDNITITTTKLMGQSLPGGKGVDMKGEFSNGGKTLTLHAPQNGMLPTELQSGIKMAKESS